MAQRRPMAAYILVALLFFQGVSGVVGGSVLAFDPSGGALGLDPVWLEGSPLPDYLVPGLILLTLLGIGPCVVAIAVLRRARRAWHASLLAGLALIVWIVVEIAIVGFMTEPPLQLVYGLAGMGIVLTTLMQAVRDHLR